MDHACLDCGQVLTKKPGPGRWPRRCSPCRTRKRNSHSGRSGGPHRLLGIRRCGWCDHEFEWRQGSFGKYCSVQCSAWGKSKVRLCEIPWHKYCWRDDWKPSRNALARLPSRRSGPAACEQCQEPIVTPRTNKRFCSERCRQRSWRPPSSPVYVINCADCGVLFVARSKPKRYCSDDCYPSGKKVNISPRRRRRIYERDGWRCQLCGQKVDRRSRYTDRAPSIDHIVPRSMGGGDEDENLHLAHRHCNAVKSNRGGGEQLALVG